MLIVDPALLDILRGAGIEALAYEGENSLHAGAARRRRCAAQWERTARSHARRSRAEYLHLGHDRPAQGGGGQPPPDRRVDPLVRRARGRRRRPALRLPADAPSVGGVVALGAPLVRGGSVVIAERFSARRFFDDRRWRVHSFQYIGELCRYLVAAPPSAAEKPHELRLALGNGLAADVWRAMLERFGEIRVLEFYASTEGNVGSTTSKAASARSAASRLISPRAIRSRSRDSMPTAGAVARRRRILPRAAEGDEAGEALGRIGDKPRSVRRL